MTEATVKSFTEVAFLEAVARRARVYLVLKPVTPGNHKQLVSRFLAAPGQEHLIIDVPQAAGQRVFVPVGWDLGMGFTVGEYFLQAPTTVLDHCQFPLYRTRRVDGLVLQRPARIVAVNRREHPRHQIDPSRCIIASLWPAGSLAAGQGVPARTGRVLNYSVRGLGICLEGSLPYEVGTEMIVRLEEAGAEEFRILKGVLKHCTEDSDGLWWAGFGDVTELAPGEAVGWIESLAGGQE